MSAKPHCIQNVSWTSTRPLYRITRWEQEHIYWRMRQRRETAEHRFATLKMSVGATQFLMKRLPKVATEMARLSHRPNL
jgi:hypothetical protein